MKLGILKGAIGLDVARVAILAYSANAAQLSVTTFCSFVREFLWGPLLRDVVSVATEQSVGRDEEGKRIPSRIDRVPAGRKPLSPP